MHDHMKNAGGRQWKMKVRATSSRESYHPIHSSRLPREMKALRPNLKEIVGRSQMTVENTLP